MPPRVTSSPKVTGDDVAVTRSLAELVKRDCSGWRCNSLTRPVFGSYCKYPTGLARLNVPTRTMSICASSPLASVTVPGKRTILPDSVISCCSRNQSFSMSSIDASVLAPAILPPSSTRNSPRSGNWMLVRELLKRPCVSPATVCNTPNSSFSAPRRSSSAWRAATI